jgi:hypothetical protein
MAEIKYTSFYPVIMQKRHTVHRAIFYLKGHGNETDFLGFLQKSVPHRFLTEYFEPFRFGLHIHGDTRNQKATPRFAESGSCRLSDSPSFLLNIQKPAPRLGESVSCRLPDSPSRRVSESPTRRVGELPTRRLAESGSRISITNIFANSKPKAERLER